MLIAISVDRSPAQPARVGKISLLFFAGYCGCDVHANCSVGTMGLRATVATKTSTYAFVRAVLNAANVAVLAFDFDVILVSAILRCIVRA